VDSEFCEVQEQIKLLHEERKKLLDALRQLEMANLEAEASGIHDDVYQLRNHKYSSLGRGKYSGTQNFYRVIVLLFTASLSLSLF
jgi:hypothetical protein